MSSGSEASLCSQQPGLHTRDRIGDVCARARNRTARSTRGQAESGPRSERRSVIDVERGDDVADGRGCGQLYHIRVVHSRR